MAVDVINYPGLIHLERQLRLPSSDLQIGQYASGDEVGFRVGSGFEIDGLIEYDGTRDAKNIDWVQSMRFGDDDTLVERQFYTEQSPLTVFVSDIPTHERYARTLGVVMSARAMGFIATHALLRHIENTGAPAMVRWSDGRQQPKSINSVRTYEGKNAAKKAITQGLSLAHISTERAQQPESRRSLFRRTNTNTTINLLEPETFEDALIGAQRKARQIADVARFIVISDFRSRFSDTEQVLRNIARNNELVTIQITHPALRGEGLHVGDVLASGVPGKNDIIETQAQLQKYKELAMQRQEDIDRRLKKVSSHTTKLDTANPKGIVYTK